MAYAKSVTAAVVASLIGASLAGNANVLKPNGATWQISSISTAGLGTARLADRANIFQALVPAAANAPIPAANARQLAVDGATLFVPSSGSTGQTAAVIGGTQIMTITGSDFAGQTTLYLGNLNPNDNTAAPTVCTVDATYAQVAIPNTASTNSRTFAFPGTNQPGLAQKGWDHQDLELEEIRGWHPRPICMQDNTNGGFKWTGLWLQVHWDCDQPGVNANTARLCTSFQPVQGAYIPLSEYTKAALKSRTTCCRSRTGLGAGRCINPNEATCCGAGAVRPGTKCCSRIVELSNGPTENTSGSEVMVAADGSCPCRSQNEITINGVVTNLDCAGNLGDRDTATETQCCLPNKDMFPAFADTANNNNYISGLWGHCLNPADTNAKCCSTGEIYNQNQVCCAVNGVQTITANNPNPCACASNADCSGTGGSCCTGSAPQGVRTNPTNCNRFINFPGSILPTVYGSVAPGNPFPADVAATCGRCYDNTFQTCCNGNLCAAKYEKCCNTQCCNRHTATCEESNVRGSGSWRFRQEDKVCSTAEHLSPFRAFFVFILPTALLFTFLGALAIVIVFANRASNRSYSFIESALVFSAAVAAIFSLPLFFSPAFKYGVVICITALVAIVAAAARIRLVNVGLVILTAVALWYVFDPIPANHWFTATSFNRVTRNGQAFRHRANEMTNGLFHTINHLNSPHDGINRNFCTLFYDGYFALDDNLRDGVRFDNPMVNTFGYCERGFVAVLLVAAGVAALALIILFVAAILALVLRFRKEEEVVPLA